MPLSMFAWMRTDGRTWARPLALLCFFGVVLALVSFPNHALFRTYALDLGLYTHAMWHYAHGRVHDSTLFLESAQPILSDHFDLYLPLFSPLVFLFGSWSLLIVQWLAVIIGAIGLRRVLQRIGMTPALADVGMTMMLLFFGVFAAMAFDYHSNVVATMVLPWFILAMLNIRRVWAVMLFLIILIGKENMGFWVGPLAIVLGTSPLVPREMRRTSILLGVSGILWSVVVVGWLMPKLSSTAEYAHFDYSILGAGLSDVPRAFWERPLEVLAALFIDHKGVPSGTALKVEFWVMMLLAGGWALIVWPRGGLMALPLIAQKMFHDDPGKWSVVAHYGVEFAPLIGIAVPVVLARRYSARWQRAMIWISLALSLAVTIHFMDMTIAYHDRSRIRIYQPIHYRKSYDLEVVRSAIALIPRDASVSAQSPAVPHLALRDTLHQFPIIKEAAYVLLMPLESPYPLDTSSYRTKVAELLEDPQWRVLMHQEEVILLRRE